MGKSVICGLSTMSKSETSQRFTEEDKYSAIESIEFAEGHLSDVDGTMFGEDAVLLCDQAPEALATLRQWLESIETRHWLESLGVVPDQE
jgi:hypothetical protein